MYGICDIGKKIEIYGENEKTILRYDGTKSSRRDGCGITLNNSESKLRNIVYEYTPKSTSYQGAIITECAGSVENVFFRISGKYAAAYLYDNSYRGNNVINCTFFHDLESVSRNYSGKCYFENIASNVEVKNAPQGTNENIIVENFGTKEMSLTELIQNSKNNNNFIQNRVGVFYGDYAWK